MLSAQGQETVGDRFGLNSTARIEENKFRIMSQSKRQWFRDHSLALIRLF
jgi:hypothetical protein